MKVAINGNFAGLLNCARLNDAESAFRGGVIMPKILGFALTGLLVSSCAIRPYPMNMCNLPILPIETALPDAHPFVSASNSASVIGCEARPAVSTYQDLLTTSLCDPPARSLIQSASEHTNILILSGGSHNGSYGAGYLEGWAEGHRLPPFKMVTGISAGAVLATSAFIGDGQIAAAQFRRIDHERLLLKTYARMKGGKITTTSYPAVIRHGAVADLAPLKTWLLDYLQPQVLDQVADRHINEQASLLVGAVDAESGKAVAIDLTKLALRHRDAKSDVEKQQARSCYADAIVASSSAPLAAKPVFIDNRTYIDGGVRFGVFQQAISASLQSVGDSWRKANEQRRAVGTASAPAPRLYLIFNGTQVVDPWCEESMTPAECDALKNPAFPAPKAREKWDLLGLGLRSVDMMVNQLQRFSVADIEQKYRLAFNDDSGFFFTRILPQHLEFSFHVDGVTKTCAGWYKYDEEHLRPVQFHPHYMKCLIAAGHAQAAADGRTGARPR